MGFIMSNRAFTWPVHPRRSYTPRMVGELAALAGVALPPWWTGAYYGRDTIGRDAEDFDADRALMLAEERADLLRDANRDLERAIQQARAQLAEVKREQRLDDHVRDLVDANRDLERDIQNARAELAKLKRHSTCRGPTEREQRLDDQVRDLVEQLREARTREGDQAREFMAVLAAVAGASRG